MVVRTKGFKPAVRREGVKPVSSMNGGTLAAIIGALVAASTEAGLLPVGRQAPMLTQTWAALAAPSAAGLHLWRASLLGPPWKGLWR